MWFHILFQRIFNGIANVFDYPKNINFLLYKRKKPRYGKGGAIYTWYDANYKFLGETWAKCIYELISYNGLIDKNSTDQFVFVSSSANKGKYERTVFDSVCLCRKNNTFIVSDIENIDNHEQSWISSDDSCKYLYSENKDDSNIIDNCRDLGINSADVIFDHKGFLWYILRTHDEDQILGAFENYYNLLKPHGALIIDNSPDKFYSLYNLVYTFTGQVYGCCERSTYRKLNKQMSKKLQAYLDDHFETVELVHAEDKRASVVAFIKKF